MSSHADITFLEFAMRTTQSYINQYEQKVAQRVNVGYHRQELAGLYDRLREYKQMMRDARADPDRVWDRST
jgi:hypothetical protein